MNKLKNFNLSDLNVKDIEREKQIKKTHQLHTAFWIGFVFGGVIVILIFTLW